MKSLYIILALILPVLSSAQDPALTENSWYLQLLIIEDNINIPPSNDEVNSVQVVFYSQTNGDDFDAFDTFVCNNLTGLIDYDNINSTFVFVEPLETTFIICNLQVNEDFEVLYFGFYTIDQTQPFTYSITTGPIDSKTLTITSASGDQAIYGNQLLSTDNYGISLFSIYPNPVKEELILESLSNNAENVEIKIYDLSGKLLSTQNPEVEKQTYLDVSQLKSGIYFLCVEDMNGQREIKKFIKE